MLIRSLAQDERKLGQLNNFSSFVTIQPTVVCRWRSGL